MSWQEELNGKYARKILLARTKDRSGEEIMIKEFMKNVEENFNFSKDDLMCMREAFSRCELYTEDGSMVALQDFGNGVIYVYYLSVVKSGRKKGKAEGQLLKILKQRSPRALAAITCHPAIMKIFDKLQSHGYGRKVEKNVHNIVIEKIKEEEGDVGRIEKARGRVIWRDFYGKEIPQKDKDFNRSELLNSGDAFLLTIQREGSE